MSEYGHSGTDGRCSNGTPNTVRIRRTLVVDGDGESDVPDVSPTDERRFARQFRRESGLE